MRIISGKYKGRQINPPTNFKARPTTDFARTGLFNILNNYFEFDQLEILDLFSGTGSIGFEFVSRNARYVEMVEKDSIHHRFIQKNISYLQINNARAVKTDVFTYLPRIKRNFDIIFADPPYEMPGIDIIPDLIFKNDILKKEGWLIIEHSLKNDFSNHEHHFDLRKYGSVRFSFFRHK